MSAHPAQIRDAVQNYIEQAYRPVLRFHVQKAVTDRLDTYFGAVASQMMYLERTRRRASCSAEPAGSSPSPASTRTQPATATSRHLEAHPRPPPRA
jgi:hypothetical protein